MRSANYVEETTTSIAGTSGDGAITLTAITNTPRFSTVFGTQATTFRYVIEDTVNKKFETGIGSVSSNVLTRTRPMVTWDGSTYDDSTPSPLQFGSSPSSGDIKIRMSATAETQGAIRPKYQSLVAGDSTWDSYPISPTIDNQHTTYTGSLVANVEYYSMYKVEVAGLLTARRFNVGTTGAGSIKAALYPMDYLGLPGDKIVDFVTTSVSTSGVKTDSATGSWSPSTGIYLTPGYYFIGQISDVAPSLTRGRPTLLPSLNKKGVYGWSDTISKAGSYATGLPAVPSLSGGTLVEPGVTTNPVFFWLGLRIES
jgi:hypothetical protein